MSRLPSITPQDKTLVSDGRRIAILEHGSATTYLEDHRGGPAADTLPPDAHYGLGGGEGPRLPPAPTCGARSHRGADLPAAHRRGNRRSRYGDILCVRCHRPFDLG